MDVNQFAKVNIKSHSKHHWLKVRLNPMGPRDTEEVHRVATPLELLFDLVFVIAIAAAAAGLHHALAETHFMQGIVQYCLVFFAIWWAWMNYSWFASAYDNDDALFRILTMIVMAGALTLAAGVSSFFTKNDLTLIVIGYVIMRLAMVVLWCRASKHDSARRKTTLYYAAGIAIVQCYWIALLLLQSITLGIFYGLFALGVLLEMLVPAIAERQGATPWHRHHIVERYGLLNIIVLGETLLAGSMALNQVSAANVNIAFIMLAFSSMVILFSLWWLYFSKEEQLQNKNLSFALTWGYGHLFIYLAGAAIGASFALLVDIISGASQTSLLVGHYAVALPVAVYLLALWFVRDRLVLSYRAKFILPIFALLILAVPGVFALEGVALLTLLCVFVRSHVVCNAQA